MANTSYFEVPGTSDEHPNIETATTAARSLAAGTDDVVEIYQCVRTLVRTVQRSTNITQTDVTPPV